MRKPSLRRTLALATTTVALAAVGVATADAGPARPAAARGVCAQPGVLFCEDFEDEALGGASSLDWGIDTRAGTMRVERVKRPATGKGTAKVLHVNTRDNGRAFLVAPVSAPSNSFYGRLTVKVKEFPTAPDWAHFTLVEASGAGAGVVRPIGGQYAPTEPGIYWGVGSDGGPTGDWTNWRTSSPVKDDKWQCVEWQFDASDNIVKVWLDGKYQADLTVNTETAGGNDVPFVFPTFDTVKIGWQLYQGGTTPESFDIWYDDVVLSTDKVGCGR